MYTRRIKGMSELKEMNLSKNDFVIYGSAPMVLRGIKEKNEDLDVLVKDNLWEKLCVKYPSNIKGEYIDINGISFTHTDKNFLGNIDEVMEKSDTIDGYRILTLEETKKWKEKVGGEKHLKDAKVIEEYLSGIEKRL